jgi:hypothetical protein
MLDYRASCHCGGVIYRATAEPVDAKICHCRVCQKLHGAPMQWAVIFHKRDVQFLEGSEHLRYFNSELNRSERILPCKVICNLCGTLIADEGRNMWLAFPSLFEFADQQIPGSFRPSYHIFYDSRIMDVDDGLPKWAGHKAESQLL